MRKSKSKIFKIILGFVGILFITLLVLPFFFKGAIQQKVKDELRENLNAEVDFNSFHLSLITDFPNLRASIKDLTVVGVDDFAGDSLLAMSSLKFSINLFSLFNKKEGPEIKSVLFDTPLLNLLVLDSGKANWDIVVVNEENENDSEQNEEGDSSYSLRLSKFSIKNGNINYFDNSGELEAFLDDLNLFMGGKLGTQRTSLNMKSSIQSFSVKSNGIPYLKDVIVGFESRIAADFENMIFSFMENELSLNDLALNFEGSLDLSDENPQVNLKYQSLGSSLKSLISLLPGVYKNDFTNIETSGMFSLSGTLNGKYVEVDSIYPNLYLKLNVEDAEVGKVGLSSSLNDINILLELNAIGAYLDSTKVDIDKLSFKLSGNPFNANLHLRTPLSNPDINGLIKGRVELSDFLDIIPMEEVKMGGTLDADLKFDFTLDDIEGEKYENVLLEGGLGMQQFLYEDSDLPVPVFIREANLLFTSSYLDLKNLEMELGRSDMLIKGKLDNYLLYFLDDQILHGSLILNSTLIDLNEWMPSIENDTIQENDSIYSASFIIPRNIDFNASATISKLMHSKLELSSLKGIVLVKDGSLILDDMNMMLLNGTIHATGEYNTADTLNPSIDMSIAAENLDIPTAFNSFNTVKTLAPFAKDLNGAVSAELFYSGKMDSFLQPDLSSISGEGRLQSKEVTILNSKAFDQIKSLAKLNKEYTNVFEDVNISFGIKDGRVVISPFDIEAGNIPVNFSGDHGLDNSLNYLLKMKVPREELGPGANKLIDELALKAQLMGIPFAMGEFIPVNLKVSGSFGNPQLSILTSGIDGSSVDAKELMLDGIKQEVGEQKEKLEEEVKKQASEEAEKIIKQAEDEVERLNILAAETAETIRKEGYAAADRLEEEAKGNGFLAETMAKKASDKLKIETDKQAENVIKEARDKGELILAEARKRADKISNASIKEN